MVYPFLSQLGSPTWKHFIRIPYVNILLHRTTHHALELQWLNFVPSADFRASITELMRLTRKHQAKVLIADNRLLRALRQADLEWRLGF